MSKTTAAFVKETKRDEYFKQRDAEIRALLDPATGNVRAEYADPVAACLLCGSKGRDTLFRKHGFSFHRCTECGFVYADPQVRDEALMQEYEGSSANDLWIDVLLSDANHAYDHDKFAAGVRLLESVTGGPGKVLDIGCSIGHFLKIARDMGWDSLGMEVNKRAVEHARNVWGLSIETKFLHESDIPPASMDAVTLWGVVEHLKDPVGILRDVFRVLRPGGALLLFCPNIESLACRVLHEDAPCVDGRNHCGYFAPRTMRYLLEKCGFEVLSIESRQPNLAPVLNHLDFLDPYTPQQESSLREILGPGMFDVLERAIQDRNLGYKIQTLARKPA